MVIFSSTCWSDAEQNWTHTKKKSSCINLFVYLLFWYHRLCVSLGRNVCVSKWLRYEQILFNIMTKLTQSIVCGIKVLVLQLLACLSSERNSKNINMKMSIMILFCKSYYCPYIFVCYTYSKYTLAKIMKCPQVHCLN